jgi:hypothetical protein
VGLGVYLLVARMGGAVCVLVFRPVVVRTFLSESLHRRINCGLALVACKAQKSLEESGGWGFACTRIVPWVCLSRSP